MTTTYVRRFNLKDSLSDAEVIQWWKTLMDEFVPLIEKSNGIRSVKLYSGAGALRADLRITLEMDHAGVYEGLLVDPEKDRKKKSLFSPLPPGGTPPSATASRPRR